SFVLCAVLTAAALPMRADAVSAKAYILMDAQTGEVIIAKNESTRLPMASTTKIMTTLLTLESGDLDTEFVIDDRALLTEGSSMGLCSGDEVTKRELCYGMMLPSGNDAANASALKLAGEYTDFADMMNDRARKIGMKNTNFVTPSGLHDKEHYSTAYDMALLTREAMKNDDFREICKTKSIKLSSENWQGDKYLTNSNKLLTKYEYCIGVKTGFTDEAGRCLVSAAEKDGVTLICVTLNAPDDWNDHIAMLDAGFASAKLTEPQNISREFTAAAVGGADDSISCRLAETPKFTAINGFLPEITEKIYMPDFVYAPVKSGDAVGYAEYYTANGIIGRTDIVAAADCAYKECEVEKPLYTIIIDFLKGFFVK
ncbi:MAG: D-alanyl-D-alanine carboxypeptidase family protein, partial [Oscillospiraceae bacterium]